MLVSLKSETILVAHQCTGLHAQQRVVCHVVTLVDVMRIIGGNNWRTNCSCNLNQFRIRGSLIRNAVVLQFNKQVFFAENILQSRRLSDCSLFVAVQQRLQYVASEAPSSCHKSGGVFLKQFPVDAGFVVIPLEKGEAG